MHFIALDTNILIYFEGFDDEFRAERARRVVQALSTYRLVIPAQVLLEFARALTVKFRFDPDQVREAIESWRALVNVVMPDEAELEAALHLSLTDRLQIFDAMILATSAAHQCVMLVSEDMHDGFTWRGCTVVNPFLEQVHPKLKHALGGQR